ncbi:alpha/beta hydrolase [Gayadomonas joobiniege]|uniref:alpha/beta hydrolase n=1 Tax=Gayadomonas joobiniege TaxID=1234606 RepID=UPI00035F40B0|nr:alpha/beta hydrolase-fold protein [Gayadomonas joobiniege]
MAILRTEVSNPAHTPDNCQFVTVFSSYLNRRQDILYYNVNADGKNLPVIILLHGVYGNAWVWLHLGGVDKAYQNIKAELGGIDFILAMPSDGGLMDGSAYLPLPQYGDFEKWIVDDVVQATKQTVRQVSESSRWYISGLSMGGYGALRLGAKYADKFSGISAHSSICQLTDLAHFTSTNLSEYKTLFSQEAELEYWFKLHQAQLPPLRFDCGKDDVLYASNVELNNWLTQHEFNYEFTTFDGEHSWDYWHQHVQTTIAFFADIEASFGRL